MFELLCQLYIAGVKERCQPHRERDADEVFKLLERKVDKVVNGFCCKGIELCETSNRDQSRSQSFL